MKRFLFMPAELVAGLEYSYNRLHDVSVGYDHDVLQNVNIYSGYLQNEWRDEKWGFLIGARVDKHSLIDNPIISPRVNVRFNPSSNYNFRASYSTGFRSPQAYDEDFHVAIVGGERVVTVLAPGLKQESSQSVSLSADLYHRFGNVQTNLLVEGFYTDLRDVFALRQLEGTDAAGNAVLERYNGSGASVMGLNLEAKAFFSSHFDIQGGVTLQRSRYKKAEQWSDNPDVPAEKRMFRTPDVYGYFTINWEIIHHLRATVTGTGTGPMLVQHMEGSGTDVDLAVNTQSFFDASVKLSYDFRLFNRGSDVEPLTNLIQASQRSRICAASLETIADSLPATPAASPFAFSGETERSISRLRSRRSAEYFCMSDDCGSRRISEAIASAAGCFRRSLRQRVSATSGVGQDRSHWCASPSPSSSNGKSIGAISRLSRVVALSRSERASSAMAGGSSLSGRSSRVPARTWSAMSEI